MASADLPDVATNAIRTIENVGDQVEHVFAEVGGHLGTAHGIFAELNSGLDSLSGELSGSKIEGASVAFQDIASRLRGLAEALPAETALLGSIGANVAQTSALLKHLITHIHLITVIARSSRPPRTVISELGGKFATLPGTASLLEESKHRLTTRSASEARDGEKLFDELYRKYTMQTEREVHLEHSDRFGIARPSITGLDVAKAASEEVLFF